jgi:hypothetical protein
VQGIQDLLTLAARERPGLLTINLEC